MNEQQKFYEQKLEFEIDSSDLYQALDNNENIEIIDARSKTSFEQEHIPGSINISHKSMSAENTSSLKKNKLYVVYCDGIGCNASTKGALNMLKLGFRVKELLGGIDWWKRDGYQTRGFNGKEGAEVKCGC